MSEIMVEAARTVPAEAAAGGGVLVLDLGGQYAQVIARRMRDLGAFSRVVPSSLSADEVALLAPDAIVLSGGPASVYADEAPSVDPQLLQLGIPTLGICYGMQLLAHHLGGEVARTGDREYGRTTVQVQPGCELFSGMLAEQVCWMSHGDAVVRAPEGAVVTATSPAAPVAAFEAPERGVYGVQFHPEVLHTEQGEQMLDRFLTVAGVTRSWTTLDIVEDQVARIREQVGEGRVVCALSGGVDSAVAAMLVHRAVGDRLTCVFVDHGFLREGEVEDVLDTFGRHMPGQLVHLDASERFLQQLEGIEDPEEKRRRIGTTFVRVFEEQMRELGGVRYLVQGTLYSDVIESGGGSSGTTATIKSHHNVGGLPADMDLELVEPLRLLFKDEARRVGSALGLPDEIVWRQPFPGPGLAIRIIGAVTRERLQIVRAADAIFRDELARCEEASDVWQAFAVLPTIRSVGVQGDGRSYAHPIVLRAVTSQDAMTADWARLPHELLDSVSRRIVNEVDGVNRVLLDVTSKPPATIEWE